MKRILAPIDGSPRSLIAVERIRKMFSPKVFEIVLIMVRENVGYVKDLGEEARMRAEMEEQLRMVSGALEAYRVTLRTAVGKAGSRIIECARETGADMIVMTRSTKTGGLNTIGMTASYVLRHAQCDVLFVKENVEDKEGYRGAVYRRASGNVNLRGQLSLKQSECLLPSVKGDAIYRIDVTRGRIRLLHRSYNLDTKDWDRAPVSGQPESYEINAGETVALPINAAGDGKIADRIRVINRNMKTEAVFHYQIEPDMQPAGQQESPAPEAADETGEAETETTTV